MGEGPPDANTARSYGRNGTACQSTAGTFPYTNQQDGKFAAFETFNAQAHDGWWADTAHREQGMKVRIEGNNGVALRGPAARHA